MSPALVAFEIGVVLTVAVRDARSLYLDQMWRDLTRYGMDQLVPVGWSLERRASVGWLLGLPFFNARDFMLVRKRPFDQRKRDLGLDWPADAETMIGMQRLTSLQRCVETVLADYIPAIWSNVECGAEGLPS